MLTAWPQIWLLQSGDAIVTLVTKREGSTVIKSCLKLLLELLQWFGKAKIRWASNQLMNGLINDQRRWVEWQACTWDIVTNRNLR